MHPDLERLVHLQHLETFSDHARRKVADLPDRLRALDARSAAAREAVDAARAALAGNQTARRSLERDLAALQGRLAKFRDQLMEVKTNREYQAMQKEIEVAQTEVRRTEDGLLERMIEADELGQLVKRTEQAAVTEQTAVDEERRRLEEEVRALQAELDRAAEHRTETMADLPPAVLAVFEQVSKLRRGTAVAEARDGHCTLCNVRLRPQVFIEIRKNDSVIQCESCQRILYFRAPPEPAVPRGGSR